MNNTYKARSTRSN